jgi:hypothetical protein
MAENMKYPAQALSSLSTMQSRISTISALRFKPPAMSTIDQYLTVEQMQKLLSLRMSSYHHV